MSFGSSGLSRRSFMATTAGAVGAMALGPTLAHAKAPLARRSGPAFFRFSVGEFELTSIYDGEVRRPLTDAYVSNAKLADVQSALAATLRPMDTTETPFSFMAINTGEKLVLIDAGSGGAYIPGLGSGADNMAAAGIDPGAVDMVIITHFHGDHTFGLTSADGKVVYPNAEIVVPEVEYRFLTGSDPLPDFKLAPLNAGAAGARQRLAAYGKRVRPYRNGEELAPGITALATPGHSPGHMSMRVSSGKEQMLVLADVVTLPHLFVPRPDWHMIFDQEPQVAEDTRRRVLDQVASDGMLIAGTHFPFPALGRIARRPSGFEYVAEPWRAKL